MNQAAVAKRASRSIQRAAAWLLLALVLVSTVAVAFQVAPGSRAATRNVRSVSDAARIRAHKHVPADSMLRAYEDLRHDLLRGDVGHSDLPEFQKFVTDSGALERIGRALLSVDGGVQRPLYTLYEELLTAPASPDLLLDYLREEMPRTKTRVSKECQHVITYAWIWAYLARASLIAWEATGDERFLDLVAETGDQVLADRDHLQDRVDAIRGRAMRAWGTCKHVKGQHTCVITYAGRIAYPLLRFTQIVRATPALQETHGKRAETYLEAAASALDEFEEDYRRIPGTNRGYYARPTRGDVEPLNHTHSAAEAFVLLHVLTGEPMYRERVEELAAYFLADLRTESNGTVTWTYQPTPDNLADSRAPAEFTWKAQITILFPVVAHEHGLAFDTAFIRALVANFSTNVHRGGLNFNCRTSADPGYQRIVGTGSVRQHCLLAGWIVLDRFDPNVRVLIEQAVARRRDIFPAGWFQKPAVVLAYAHRLKAPAAALRADTGARPLLRTAEQHLGAVHERITSD